MSSYVHHLLSTRGPSAEQEDGTALAIQGEVPVQRKDVFRLPRTTTNTQSFLTPSTTSQARPTIMRSWQVNTLPCPPINHFNPSPSLGRTDRGHPPDYEALSPSRQPKTQESGRERNCIQFQGWNTWRKMDERWGGEETVNSFIVISINPTDQQQLTSP